VDVFVPLCFLGAVVVAFVFDCYALVRIGKVDPGDEAPLVVEDAEVQRRRRHACVVEEHPKQALASRFGSRTHQW
jgi:hypothetical protein